MASPAMPAVDVRPLTVRRPRTPGLHLESLAELIRYGDLFRTLTEHRIRVRYKQSLLGLGWAIVQPVSMMLIFTLVFGRIARVPSDGVPYSLFGFTGLLIWSFVSTSLSNGTHALVANAPLVTKVYFPREVLPLSYVAAALFDLMIGVVLLLALLAWYGRPIGWELLMAAPVIATAAVLTCALAFALSALQVHFRDVGLAIPLALYLWMFCTPIAYPLSAVPGRYRALFTLHPLTGDVEGFRRVVLAHEAPSWALLGPSLAASLVLLPLAYLYFKHAEATMADVI
jgi:lipopolysaccharide transport system permease protein